jgi:hypothetical protein
MAKKPANANKRWTKQAEKELRKLAKGNTPTGLLAYKLKRTEPGVRGKASEMGVSLKPTNKSPYNRRKN